MREFRRSALRRARMQAQKRAAKPWSNVFRRATCPACGSPRPPFVVDLDPILLEEEFSPCETEEDRRLLETRKEFLRHVMDAGFKWEGRTCPACGYRISTMIARDGSWMEFGYMSPILRRVMSEEVS